MNFNLELISMIEAHVLIIISLGLLGIRYFFHDQINHDKKYNFIHILILMVFTIFSLELLIIMVAFYFYNDLIDIAVLSPDLVTYYIFLPKLIFYTTLCYFIYWILKLFQTQNSEKVYQLEQSFVDPEKLILDFMKSEDFKPKYLLREIRFKEVQIWKGILNSIEENELNEIHIGDYTVVTNDHE